jgi:PIN domain nuclease of toxin-antitoxin system
MKLLLDTHAFIWWASAPERLSDEALAACQGRNNSLVLSVASVGNADQAASGQAEAEVFP